MCIARIVLSHRIGLGPHTPTLVDRTKAEVAGTLLTAELALHHGLACNTAGGTHHAHAGFGSGFCILNDLAFTASVLLQRGAVQRVLILDLDVHQVRVGQGGVHSEATGKCCCQHALLWCFSLNVGWEHAMSNAYGLAHLGAAE